ncbi:flagellar basal body rod protein FlgB [Brevibacillus dissolubilis]|uniref:flagellar basal body rod protein FlgB n=1 Tax=Brevibacillus dissolubilis TaxID=1844116 RepID=UPI001115E39A|nr:flagellar basal body rod protein FlgB [Brevibacillus dissolubilis]
MLNTNQLRLLERSLDVATLRQRTIANNIANADTPHFKSKQVVFEDLLQQEMNGTASKFVPYTTDSRHLQMGKGTGQSVLSPQIVSNPSTMMQNNENNVDIEYEMSQQAKNQIWYNGLVQMTNGYFTKLKSVIEGGGR